MHDTQSACSLRVVASDDYLGAWTLPAAPLLQVVSGNGALCVYM